MVRYTQPGLADLTCMAPHYVTQQNQLSHSENDYNVCDCGCFFKDSKMCSFCLATQIAVTFGATGWSVSVARKDRLDKSELGVACCFSCLAKVYTRQHVAQKSRLTKLESWQKPSAI